MKVFIVVILFISLGQVQASEYKSTKCSNSDGSVVWQSGDQEETIQLKYSHFIEGTLVLDLDQVHIKLEQEILVQEKSIKECTYAALTRVFASKVLITPADKNPDILISLFPQNKVETEVICTFQMTAPRYCPTMK